MSVFASGTRWIGLTVATLLLTALLSGCTATVTTDGLLIADTVLVRPIVDYREPAPEVVETLEEIAEEQGVDVTEACIDLNEADEETLQLIVHIGPQRAYNIAVLRALFEFNSPADLRILNGIGEKRVADIEVQNLVCDLSGKG